TLAFCEKAKHTELLMKEGVSISFPEREPDPAQIAVVSEEDLVQHLVRLELENPNRQITFNGIPANVVRFAKIIENTPRTVVL
ncbi:MBL fold metallo-hydrolase, partial [Enterococcus faecalis]